jgi:hypothetical protein
LKYTILKRLTEALQDHNERQNSRLGEIEMKLDAIEYEKWMKSPEGKRGSRLRDAIDFLKEE